MRPATIRPALEDDAATLIGILRGIAAERVHTAIDEPWSVEAQRQYIASQSPREAIFLAEIDGSAVGYQVLSLWAGSIRSMAHVGQLGTFLRPEFRGRGIGSALFEHALGFARSHSYRKFVIQVRESNRAAQAFYQRMGFAPCGRLARQVEIGGVEEDELILERGIL